MLTFLTIGAGSAGAVGLILTARNKQWRSPATTAYAAASVLMAVALYSVRSDRVEGPDVPTGCIVVDTSGSFVMLSCPVAVKLADH